jgi:perosamine synthetase
MKLPITKTYFSDREFELIQKPLSTGWLVQGVYVREFEQKIADFTGAKHAIALNSCTSGQFIMSEILGLKEGDEVIVPSFTWISTVNSIEYLGAKAVFCDIDIRTFNIDVTQIESKITPRTKAIYPVNLFGLAADMPKIMEIAHKYNLQVVEDCACSLGGKIGDTHTGLFGIAGIFSFHPRKSITTGEGGMIITNDDYVAKMAASLRDHGAMKTDFDRHHQKGSFLLTEYHNLGFNLRMTDIQGALGVAQAEKLTEILEKKQQLVQLFDQRIAEITWLAKPYIPENYTHGWQNYCTLFKPTESLAAIQNKDYDKIMALNEERNRIMAELEEIGISTRQGTHAVHIQKLYREKYNIQPTDYPASFAADKLTVALPFYPAMTIEEVDYLFENLKKIKL